MHYILSSQLRTLTSRGVQAVKTARCRAASPLCIYLIRSTLFSLSKLHLMIRTPLAIRIRALLQVQKITKSLSLKYKGKLWSLTSMRRLRNWKGRTLTTRVRISIINREKMCNGINSSKLRALQILNLQIKLEWSRRQSAMAVKMRQSQASTITLWINNSNLNLYHKGLMKGMLILKRNNSLNGRMKLLR